MLYSVSKYKRASAPFGSKFYAVRDLSTRFAKLPLSHGRGEALLRKLTFLPIEFQKNMLMNFLLVNVLENGHSSFQSEIQVVTIVNVLADSVPPVEKL